MKAFFAALIAGLLLVAFIGSVVIGTIKLVLGVHFMNYYDILLGLALLSPVIIISGYSILREMEWVR